MNLMLECQGNAMVLAPGKTYTLGRAAGCDFAVESDRVSRRHLEVTHDGTNWLITDLDSTNGTYVGGRSIKTHVLTGPVAVVLGGSQGVEISLAFEPSAGAVRAPVVAIPQAVAVPHDMPRLEVLWAKANFKPNDDQRDAILHLDGPLFITAGPGSGKTRVLLWRTVNLIVYHGVRPEDIFLSTFTDKAAHQLREGLRTLLGLATNFSGQQYDLSLMYLGTVHSLCQRMLSDRRRFSIDRHRNRPPQLIDELGQYFHISRNRTWRNILENSGLAFEDGPNTINQIWGISSASKHLAVTNLQGIFNRFSEESIDVEAALKMVARKAKTLDKLLAPNELSSGHVGQLLRLYGAYRGSLQAAAVPRTDFALLQQAAFDALRRSPESGLAFKHVIVDEYQDTNGIQEKLFFELAAGYKNICVVGDDDQAMYRFRGATVENFVEFPARCKDFLGVAPARMSLNANYRSLGRIVDLYNSFLLQTDWTKPGGGMFRIADKAIRASRSGKGAGVVASQPAPPEDVATEIAALVKSILEQGKVQDPSQIAFLFPSFKYLGDVNSSVVRMKEALEAVGLKVYAPRAGRFLEVDEARAMFGLMFLVLGRPPAAEFRGRDYNKFLEWCADVEQYAEDLLANDKLLKQFVKVRQAELREAAADYTLLQQVVQARRWDLAGPYQPDEMKRILHGTGKISERCKKLLASASFDRYSRKRVEQKSPLSLLYVLRRVTSVDWNLLDLFYHLCGFQHFKAMFDAAEKDGDEGPVANLGLITKYLSRFIDERVSIITADFLAEGILQIVFQSYLYSLYRLAESEFEDADDPFPKGRIPFLTIHQAKGLEFPVVVLGNLRKEIRGASVVEHVLRPLLTRAPGEPLDRISEFDINRMYYVALSRAKNLLVLAHFKGRGQRINPPFRALLGDGFPRIAGFDVGAMPVAELDRDALPRSYSYTSDFLTYKKCPRQYMIFRKFAFVPSRSQTMFFGSLVHRTLEDLHHEVIRRRVPA